MKDDRERELRELFTRREADPAEPAHTPPGLVRRIRRRQALTILASLATVTAVVVASFAAVRVVSKRDEARPADVQVVLPDAPQGFLSAALPYASIAYPDGWYLLDTSPLVAGPSQAEEPPPGPILQLSNFDPDVPHAPRCWVEPDQVPVDGVLLSVAIVSSRDAESLPSEGSWPVALHDPPSNTEPVCEVGTSEQATWTAPSGVQFTAQAIYGEHASEADVAAIERAFSTLLFPPTAQPQLSRLGAIQGLGTPRVVLGTTTLGSDVLTFVAYLELGRVLWVGVESSGPYGGATAPHSGSDPDPPMSAGLAVVAPEGALLYGTISPVVERVEVVTDAGDVAPVTVVPLPASLGLDDRFVWATVPGGGEQSTMVGYDADGNTFGNPVFPAGPRVTIATGTDTQGGPWTLYLDVTNMGTGIGFGFDNGGGGSGCCLKPLQGDFRLDGWGSGGDEPSNITALASEVVTRVVFEAASGTQIEGQLFPIPDESLGIPKVALVLVPHDVPLEGDLVAYDAVGNELGREVIVSDVGEPPGPTTQIEAVWQSLRAVRDAAAGYLERHGTFETVTPDALIELTTEPVTIATRPNPETVSLYISDQLHMAISSTAITGEAYCIAIEADGPQGGFNYRYGALFARSYDECRGGWPELGT